MNYYFLEDMSVPVNVGNGASRFLNRRPRLVKLPRPLHGHRSRDARESRPPAGPRTEFASDAAPRHHSVHEGERIKVLNKIFRGHGDVYVDTLRSAYHVFRSYETGAGWGVVRKLVTMHLTFWSTRSPRVNFR